MRVLIVALALAVAQRPATPFTTPLSLADMQNKQAVVETTLGEFVIDLLPQAAPNHVGYLIKLAREGAYDGTTFHRAVRLADASALDGQYTAFGRVVTGLDVVEKIEAVEVDGETPRARIELRRVRVN
ncbi:MAG: peptidylprolyl isomerase [Vicinamibacterales bacterium]